MSRSRHQATHGGGTRLGSDGTVFIHLDLNAFYSQVSAQRLSVHPSLPVVTQQWGSLIAISYAARRFGLSSRLGHVSEARKLCSHLVALHVEVTGSRGEPVLPNPAAPPPEQACAKVSLAQFRAASQAIFAMLVRILGRRCVERGSLDEAYMDASGAIRQMLTSLLQCEEAKCWRGAIAGRSRPRNSHEASLSAAAERAAGSFSSACLPKASPSQAGSFVEAERPNAIGGLDVPLPGPDAPCGFYRDWLLETQSRAHAGTGSAARTSGSLSLGASSAAASTSPVAVPAWLPSRLWPSQTAAMTRTAWGGEASSLMLCRMRAALSGGDAEWAYHYATAVGGNEAWLKDPPPLALPGVHARAVAAAREAAQLDAQLDSGSLLFPPACGSASTSAGTSVTAAAVSEAGASSTATAAPSPPQLALSAAVLDRLCGPIITHLQGLPEPWSVSLIGDILAPVIGSITGVWPEGGAGAGGSSAFAFGSAAAANSATATGSGPDADADAEESLRAAEAGAEAGADAGAEAHADADSDGIRDGDESDDELSGAGAGAPAAKRQRLVGIAAAEAHARSESTAAASRGARSKVPAGSLLDLGSRLCLSSARRPMLAIMFEEAVLAGGTWAAVGLQGDDIPPPQLTPPERRRRQTPSGNGRSEPDDSDAAAASDTDTAESSHPVKWADGVPHPLQYALLRAQAALQGNTAADGSCAVAAQGDWAGWQLHFTAAAVAANEAALRLYARRLLEALPLTDGYTPVLLAGAFVGQYLRWRLRQELGLTASVGVGFTQTLAKIGSGRNKPAKMTLFPLRAHQAFLDRLPLRDLPALRQQRGAHIAAAVCEAALARGGRIVPMLGEDKDADKGKAERLWVEDEAGGGSGSGAAAGATAAGSSGRQGSSGSAGGMSSAVTSPTRQSGAQGRAVRAAANDVVDGGDVDVDAAVAPAVVDLEAEAESVGDGDGEAGLDAEADADADADGFHGSGDEDGRFSSLHRGSEGAGRRASSSSSSAAVASTTATSAAGASSASSSGGAFAAGDGSYDSAALGLGDWSCDTPLLDIPSEDGTAAGAQPTAGQATRLLSLDQLRAALSRSGVGSVTEDGLASVAALLAGRNWDGVTSNWQALSAGNNKQYEPWEHRCLQEVRDGKLTPLCLELADRLWSLALQGRSPGKFSLTVGLVVHAGAITAGSEASRRAALAKLQRAGFSVSFSRVMHVTLPHMPGQGRWRKPVASAAAAVSSSSSTSSAAVAIDDDDERDDGSSTIAPPAFTYGGASWQPLYPLESSSLSSDLDSAVQVGSVGAGTTAGAGAGTSLSVARSAGAGGGSAVRSAATRASADAAAATSSARLTATAADLLERFRAVGFAQREKWKDAAAGALVSAAVAKLRSLANETVSMHGATVALPLCVASHESAAEVRRALRFSSPAGLSSYLASPHTPSQLYRRAMLASGSLAGPPPAAEARTPTFALHLVGVAASDIQDVPFAGGGAGAGAGAGSGASAGAGSVLGMMLHWQASASASAATSKSGGDRAAADSGEKPAAKRKRASPLESAFAAAASAASSSSSSTSIGAGAATFQAGSLLSAGTRRRKSAGAQQASLLAMLASQGKGGSSAGGNGGSSSNAATSGLVPSSCSSTGKGRGTDRGKGKGDIRFFAAAAASGPSAAAAAPRPKRAHDGGSKEEDCVVLSDSDNDGGNGGDDRDVNANHDLDGSRSGDARDDSGSRKARLDGTAAALAGAGARADSAAECAPAAATGASKRDGDGDGDGDDAEVITIDSE